MGIDLLPAFIRAHYEVHEWKHAYAILKQDFPAEWADICDVLAAFRLKRSWITVGGGRKSKVSEAIDSELYRRSWAEKKFTTSILVDETRTESPTHQVDCVKNRVALEIEWNNKDPFFDRDLNQGPLCSRLMRLPSKPQLTRQVSFCAQRVSFCVTRRIGGFPPCLPTRRGSFRTGLERLPLSTGA